MDQTSKQNQSTGLEMVMAQEASVSSNQLAETSSMRANIFTNGEIEIFYRLYRYGRQHRQANLTRFTALEDFILETRRSSGFIESYNDIEDILGNNDQRASLMRSWLCQVAPSCVFRHRCSEYGQTSFFKCCFSTCATPVSSQYALIRHYREQHYSQIPPGIFGNLVLHSCNACGLQFKREEHLNQHFSSLSHITHMAMLGTRMVFFSLCMTLIIRLICKQGSDTSKRHLAALEQSRQYAESVQIIRKENRLSNEEDVFYAAIQTSSTNVRLAIEQTPRLAITAAPSALATSNATASTTNPTSLDAHTSSPESEDEDKDSGTQETSQPLGDVDGDDDDDTELSQRTASQLNINSDSQDDQDMLNNLDGYEVAGVTPKSPKISSHKRKLSDDDGSENDVPKKINKPEMISSSLFK